MPTYNPIWEHLQQRKQRRARVHNLIKYFEIVVMSALCKIEVICFLIPNFIFNVFYMLTKGKARYSSTPFSKNLTWSYKWKPWERHTNTDLNKIHPSEELHTWFPDLGAVLLTPAKEWGQTPTHGVEPHNSHNVQGLPARHHTQGGQRSGDHHVPVHRNHHQCHHAADTKECPTEGIQLTAWRNGEKPGQW